METRASRALQATPASRGPAIILNRLTEMELANAIAGNVINDDCAKDDYADEEEMVIDNDTGTEAESQEEDASANEENAIDSESAESSENEDSDDDNAMDVEIDADVEVFVGRDNTEWRSVPEAQFPENAGRVSRGNFHKVNLPPGKRLDTALECFRCIFDDIIIDTIVQYTNIEARKHEAAWNDLDAIEVLAYIGLLIAAGVDRSSKRNYEEFFGPLRGMPLFRSTMAKNRFKSILRYIRFDDKNTRSVRRTRDKLAPIRDVFDMVCNNLKRVYSPGQFLTIDEQLVPFRGRCSFKQYLPSKPDKYGLKLFWICDAETWYPLNAIPYLGRERSGLARRTNINYEVVSTLCQPYQRSKRNITFDNFFTTYELAQHLKSVGLTCVGTVRKNKRFIPPEFLPNTRREIGSNLFGFRANATLLSHVPKRKKAVIFLSTFHHTPTIDASGKAEINTMYNKTKGGVDALDELCHTYTAQRRTNRWSNAFFMNLINIAGIAAHVIYRNVNNLSGEPIRQHRKNFLMDLSAQLTFQQIKNRSKIGLYLGHQAILNETIEAIDPGSASTSQARSVRSVKRRCAYCPWKKHRKVKQICAICKKNVCNEHAISILKCKKCSAKPILNSSDSE